MALSPDEVALELIGWRSRLDAGVRSWPGPPSFRRLFSEHLRREYGSQHSEEVSEAADAFSKRPTRLVDWYGAVLEPFAASLTFRAGAPGLALGHMTRWRHLTSQLDADALIAWRIAEHARPSDSSRDLVDRLNSWGTYLTLHDRGLEIVLERGLADAHVHIEACDPVPLLWLRTMFGEVRTRSLPSYAVTTLDALRPDPIAFDRRSAELGLVERAIAARKRLSDRFSIRFGYKSNPVALKAALHAERSLLVSAWRAVRTGAHDVEADLDGYLAAKAVFLRRHIQSHGAGLGLYRFREFLDRGETLEENKTKKKSVRVRIERYTRMLSLATEAPHLRRLELRVAPVSKPRDWIRLFRIWEHRSEGPLAERSIETGFVVHFIRNADSGPGRTTRMRFGKLREALDRQTAVLQSFRHEHPTLARHVVGIDVANLERGCPPEIFAPYLKLLRGEFRGDLGAGHPALSNWSRLAVSGKDRHPTTLPNLGLTYHAGEDFTHPLEGLRHISGLLEHVLEPGDRIGHGLAAGWDLERHYRTRRAPRISQGNLLDDLVWLRREARLGSFYDGEAVWIVDRAIEELTQLVYGKLVPDYSLEKMLELRYEIPDLSPAPISIAAALVHAENFDGSVMDLRAAPAPLEIAAVPRQARATIAEAQSQLIRKVRTRGVTIEANPSSNLATGTVERLVDHPFFSFHELLDCHALHSFNTDDPAIFGTRIDIEYALMFEAMISRDYDRSQALEAIDRARLTGMEQVFMRSTAHALSP